MTDVQRVELHATLEVMVEAGYIKRRHLAIIEKALTDQIDLMIQEVIIDAHCEYERLNGSEPRE